MDSTHVKCKDDNYACFHILVVNGILAHDIISDVLMKAVEKSSTNLAGKIIIGATRWPAGWKHVSTNITRMNIFSYALSVNTMIATTKHKFDNCDSDGDYLSWDEMEWETHGDVTTHIVGSDQPCKKELDIMLYYTEFAKMSDCMHHCQKLGGRAPKVVTQEDWHRLQEFMNNNYYGKVQNTLGALWLSVTDKDKEGEWNDFYSGELMQYKGPFTGTGPNGGERENCAVQVTYDTWVDGPCNAKGYGAFCSCSHETRPLLRMRGLCSSSFLEKMFIPRSSVTDARDLHYVGEKGAKISYNEEQQQWSLTKWEVIGYSISSKGSYVLGMHNWTIVNDTYECNNGKSYSVQLKLTSCSDGQFTCNSGQCVNMEDRCDQFSDCRDESDEKDCDLLTLREGYNKKIPPHNTRTFGNKSIPLLLPVKVSIDLLKIVGIDEGEHSIDLQFQIEMEWLENRATYKNLKENSGMNVLSEDGINSLWLPLITYTNTDQKDTTRLGMQNEWSTSVKVRREGNLTRGGLELVDEVELFQGDQNPIVMTQVYTKTFQCQYDFQLYPFDTQTCTITMDASADDLSIVELVAHKLLMNVSLDLTLFKITSSTLESTDVTDVFKGVIMNMSLKRKVMNELLTTFLPSILLMTITFATTFFKPFFFEAALSVNLTTMLMMTTISIGKMQTLPTTAYIRMIDVWLVFCQLVPFVEVILLTAQEYYRVDDPKEEQDDAPKPGDQDVGQAALVQVAVKNVLAAKEAAEDNNSAALALAEKDHKNLLNKRQAQLKIIGEFFLGHSNVFSSLSCNFSEKGVLPMAVGIFSLVYFSIALAFYFA